MKKGLIKILTIGLSIASIASYSLLGAFALEHSEVPVLAPGITDTMSAYKTIRTITVKNVVANNGLKVTAYQLAKGKYNETKKRMESYEYCGTLGTGDIKDLENPTSDEVTTIANKINSEELVLPSAEMKQDGKDYKLNAEAGEYLILVTGSNDVIYNPAVVSVNVPDPEELDNAGAAVGGSVDMDSDTFKYKNELGQTVVAYLKSSKPTLDKSVVGSVHDGTEFDTKDNNPNGDTIAFGDTVKFKIETVMLSYSKDYQKLTFKISDKLAKNAFKGVNNLNVAVGNTETVNANDGATVNYTIRYLDDDGNVAVATDATRFEVAFAEEYIRSHGNQTVVITYDSLILGTAGYNYAENKNTAELEYSNDPESNGTGKKKDRTYHYTFAIDAEIDSQSTKKTPEDNGDQDHEETNEIIKVTKSGAERDVIKDDNGEYITTTSSKALEGAEFKLFSDEACQNPIPGRVAVSDARGFLTFKGLDEGVYYLKETAAPQYYIKNDNAYRITITASLEASTGILEWYSIVTDLQQIDETTGDITYTTAGSVKYTNEYVCQDDESLEDFGDVENTITVDGASGTTENITSYVESVEIVDPKLAELPSTGGKGTIALTIGSSIAMAVFLTIHVVNKKKSKIAD